MTITKQILEAVIKEQTVTVSVVNGHDHFFTWGDTQTSVDHKHSHVVKYTNTTIKIMPGLIDGHTHEVVDS